MNTITEEVIRPNDALKRLIDDKLLEQIEEKSENHEYYSSMSFTNQQMSNKNLFDIKADGFEKFNRQQTCGFSNNAPFKDFTFDN